LKRFLITLLCSAAAACGSAGDASLSRGARPASVATRSDRAAALAALFDADAAHTAAIAQLGPVEGLVRALRGNALYLAANLDIVQGGTTREPGLPLLNRTRRTPRSGARWPVATYRPTGASGSPSVGWRRRRGRLTVPR
jgi:hypothetical protein